MPLCGRCPSLLDRRVRDGVNTSIAGDGFNTLSGRHKALLRTRPLPSPPCPADFNGDGFVDFFDDADFVEAFETGC